MLMLSEYSDRICRLAADRIREEWKRRQDMPEAYGLSDWSRVYRAEDAIAEALPRSWRIKWPKLDDPAPVVTITKDDGSTFTL